MQIPRITGGSCNKQINSKPVQKNATFVIMSLNCQSIRNKVQDIISYLEEKHTDIGVLQETWLTKGDKNIIAEIKELGYGVHNLIRTTGRGGGVAIVYKPKLDVKRYKITTKFKSFEVICSSFTLNKRNIKLEST